MPLMDWQLKIVLTAIQKVIYNVSLSEYCSVLYIFELLMK